MKKEEKILKDRLSDEMESVIENSGIHWRKSKEEVWLELEKKLDKVPEERVIGMVTRWPAIAIAAGIALLLGLTAFMRFYTTTVTVPAGMHAEIYLPDKSKVNLNAQSIISYRPLFWKISREVKFEGEGYFNVVKGKSFEVISEKGKTAVLGTSFNIYSRDDSYEVTCITGKVKVTEFEGNREVILEPGSKSFLGSDGALLKEAEPDTEATLSWLNNKLNFNSVPLKKVFEEIGRQYGVLIIAPEQLDRVYTGAFMKDDSVENVLNMVCRPFDLKFSRKSENEYILSGNN